MERFEQLTAKYLDEGLSPLERQELAKDLGTDPEGRRQVLALYSQDRLLAELHRSEDLPAIKSIMAAIRGEERAFVGSVMQRVREEPDRNRPTLPPTLPDWLSNWWPWWPVWTGILAVLAIALSWFLFWPAVGRPVLLVTSLGSVVVERRGESIGVLNRLALQPDDMVAVGQGEIATIDFLPETTRLELTPGTTVKLLGWANGKEIELRQGDLKANVARQRIFRPFRVRSAQAEARVLGTTFLLAAGTNMTRLEVSEGKVRFTRRSDDKHVDVTKGHYAIAAAGADLTSLPQTGSLLREIWTDVPGAEVNDLLDHPNYPKKAHRP
jgi:hypothetical protein